MNRLLRIATRKSPLALWQSEHVAAALRAAHPGLEVVLVPMSTRGDEVLDRSLAAIGGKGLFLKELELAMQRGDADCAVHSLKDVPMELEPGFALAAILARADHADAFVSARFDAIAKPANSYQVVLTPANSSAFPSIQWRGVDKGGNAVTLDSEPGVKPVKRGLVETLSLLPLDGLL